MRPSLGERPLVERFVGLGLTAKLPDSPSRINPTIGIAGCCALAATGHAVTEPTIPRMKSCRRIAFSKAWDCADYCSERIDYSRVLRPPEWGPTVICVAIILSTECPLWVKSEHIAPQQTSLDYFVGSGNERSGKFKAERLRGL